MGRSRRVTLRCATEDFSQGWSTQSDLTAVQNLRKLALMRSRGEVADSTVATHLRQMPTLSRLRHPLILAFDDQFSGEDDRDQLRETISAVKDRTWFKQTYSSRWRGAAILISEVGSEIAWLGAAGYHRQGSPEDFYTQFARDCGQGSDRFLPQAEDKVVQAVEAKVGQLDAWKLQLHLTALLLLNTALDDMDTTYETQVSAPDQTPLLDLAMTVVTSGIQGSITNELLIEVRPEGWERPHLCDTASRVVCSAIDSQTEAWTHAPLVGPAMSHCTVLTAGAINHARAVAESGEIDANARPGEVRLGTIAHYAPRESLTRATVEGEAVRAMCGHWFVPIADHEHLPKCETCRANFQKLTQ